MVELLDSWSLLAMQGLDCTEKYIYPCVLCASVTMLLALICSASETDRTTKDLLQQWKRYNQKERNLGYGQAISLVRWPLPLLNPQWKQKRWASGTGWYLTNGPATNGYTQRCIHPQLVDGLQQLVMCEDFHRWINTTSEWIAGTNLLYTDSHWFMLIITNSGQ